MHPSHFTLHEHTNSVCGVVQMIIESLYLTDDIVTLLHPDVQRKLKLGETIATQGTTLTIFCFLYCCRFYYCIPKQWPVLSYELSGIQFHCAAFPPAIMNPHTGGQIWRYLMVLRCYIATLQHLSYMSSKLDCTSVR